MCLVACAERPAPAVVALVVVLPFEIAVVAWTRLFGPPCAQQIDAPETLCFAMPSGEGGNEWVSPGTHNSATIINRAVYTERWMLGSVEVLKLSMTPSQ